jgi:predicted glycosyltransferase
MQQPTQLTRSDTLAAAESQSTETPKKVWIDLDNSPHVPFFLPIIDELQKRGYSMLITARDCFQVCELADRLGLEYEPIGRHYGKNAFLKLAGLGARAIQLAPTILREKPDLALSHGSRAQLFLSKLLGVPSIVAIDYEFAQGLVLLKPHWIMVPEVIPDGAIREKSHVLKYPGIKEDVYVPRFKPDSAIRRHLGLSESELVVTLRPPANEAHYHNPQSDELFDTVVAFLSDIPNLKMVILPRNDKQALALRKLWPRLFALGKILIPEHAVDGLNLIWHSDLVVSGGGTMNREAAALHVPVYSVFRGKIGAVDRYLANSGRLTLLETIEDIPRKIRVERRDRQASNSHDGGTALRYIVDEIVRVLGIYKVPARH